jgi:hypothetical protein
MEASESSGVPVPVGEGVRDRAKGAKLLVNYLYFELYHEEEDRIAYKNRWITNHSISKENARGIVECGRARWKIEHEHNHVLKHHGYNLKYNFGHGENHANGVFCLLNVPAFLFHGIQGLADEDYRKARAFSGPFGTRPQVTPMKPGMTCSLPSPAMSLMVEFGIAASGPASGHYLNLWMCLNIWVHFFTAALWKRRKKPGYPLQFLSIIPHNGKLAEFPLLSFAQFHFRDRFLCGKISLFHVKSR